MQMVWRLIALLLLPLLLTAADYNPPVIAVPSDVAQTARPFLHAIIIGDRKEAAKYVSPSAQAQLEDEFDDLKDMLAKAAPLTPRHISKRDYSTPAHREVQENFIYASQKGGRWTRANLQFLRYDNDPPVIEKWEVDHAIPYAPELAVLQQMGMPFFYVLFGGMALLGLAGLAILLFIVRKKPALISPEIEAHKRARAVSTREH